MLIKRNEIKKFVQNHKMVVITMFVIAPLFWIYIGIKEIIDKKKLAEKGICTNSGIIYYINLYGKSPSYGYHFYVNGVEINRSIGVSRTREVYGENTLIYVGKKVRVKYLPNNPKNSTLVSWEEPCKCDSLNQ